jgi:acyl-CoA synthetase (AMP-forming)/AMP-acid ligase II
MLVSDILEQAFLNHADKPAVWYRGLWKTYRELRGEAEQIAAFLVEAGVNPGDRVALLLEDSFEYICAHFGALKAGAVDDSLNTELKASGLHELLLDCEAKVLIADARLLLGSIEALNGLPQLQHVLSDTKREDTAFLPSAIQAHAWPDPSQAETIDVPPPARAVDDLASLIYTSGVTGRPKGVMLSHANLVSNA